MIRSSKQLELDAERIFLDSLEIGPDEQETFVRDACGDDAELLKRVRELLAHASSAPSTFLTNESTTELPFDSNPSRKEKTAPHTIGPYSVIRLLGVGGMGAVYEAIESETQQRVAIKLLQSAFATPEQLARFRREATILAKLEHPAIAKLHGVGSAETIFGSHPYIAMDFVDGRNLRDWCRAPGRTIAERVELIATICEAIQASHDCGIVHRDLKPANILVDETNQPRILDFGISQITHAGNGTATVHTETGQFVGTLAYMSPEQVSADPKIIDTRSDIFSLGVVLYEMLSGTLPFDVIGQSLERAAQAIRENEPSHLSRFDSELRGDLAAIVAKALEKNPERRYQTAGEMAADLRRHLKSEPVTAQRPSAWRQVTKFTRRHRKLVAATLVIFATLLTATYIATKIAIRETRLRAIAERKNYRAGLLTAQLALQSDNIIEARRIVDELAKFGSENWEYRYLKNSLEANSELLTGHAAPTTSIEVSSDGTHLLSASEDSTVRLWNIENGAVQVIRGHDGPVRQAFFINESARIASLSDDGTIRIWDAATAIELRRISGANWSPVCIDISPNDRFIAATCSDQRLRIWEIENARLVMTSPPHTIPISLLRYLDDKRILVGEHRGLSCWSASTGAYLSFADGQFDFHPSSIFLSENGDQLLTSCNDATMTLWDVATLKPNRVIQGQLGGVLNAVLDETGTRVVSAGADNTVRVWNAQTGDEVFKLIGHVDAVTSVAIIPGTSKIASGSADRSIRIWNLEKANRSTACRVLSEHSRYVYDIAFMPNSDVFASAAWDGTVKFWNVNSGQLVRSLDADPQRVECIAFSPDGRLLATGTSQKIVKLWDADSLELKREFEIPNKGVKSVAFDPEGNVLLAVTGLPFREDPVWHAIAWRLSDGEVISRLTSDSPLIATSLTSGLRLIEATPGDAKVIDPVSNKNMITFAGHAETMTNASYSSDGEHFVTSSDDGTAAVWNAKSGARLEVLRGHSDKVYDAVFSPDGARIATASNDNTIRIWDARNYEELLVLPGHSKYVYCLAFSPDGNTLVSGSGDHTIRLWTAALK